MSDSFTKELELIEKKIQLVKGIGVSDELSYYMTSLAVSVYKLAQRSNSPEDLEKIRPVVEELHLLQKKWKEVGLYPLWRMLSALIESKHNNRYKNSTLIENYSNPPKIH